MSPHEPQLSIFRDKRKELLVYDYVVARCCACNARKSLPVKQRSRAKHVDAVSRLAPTAASASCRVNLLDGIICD